MKTKKQNPNEWCKGLYLAAGTYKENEELLHDTPVEFISSAIIKLKGLPLIIRRELLSENDYSLPSDSGLSKRVDMMVSEHQYNYLREKALRDNSSVSEVIRRLIDISEMEDYSGTKEAKKDSKYITKP